MRDAVQYHEVIERLQRERDEASAEVERLKAERDDHKERLAVEAFTAPDADYDTMVDSLQARIRDSRATHDAVVVELDKARADNMVLSAVKAELLVDLDEARAELQQAMGAENYYDQMIEARRKAQEYRNDYLRILGLAETQPPLCRLPWETPP